VRCPLCFQLNAAACSIFRSLVFENSTVVMEILRINAFAEL
jgi:hypothetical protein